MPLLVTAAFTAFQFWLTQSVNAVVFIVLAFPEGTLTQPVELYNYNNHAFHCPDWPLDINEVKTRWTWSMDGAHIASAYRQGQRDPLTVTPRDNPEKKSEWGSNDFPIVARACVLHKYEVSIKSYKWKRD